MHVAVGNFLDIVGLFAAWTFGVFVVEGLIFIEHVAEAVGLSFFHRVEGFLIACLEDEQFELFLVFGIGIILYGVACYNDGTLVVVAHVVAEVVVELCVLQLFESKFVLHLEYGILSYGHFVAAREVFEEALKFFYSLDGAGLVELRLGRVQIVSVAAEEAGRFGVLAFGVAAVVGFEVCARAHIVFVLVVAHGKEI